VPTDGAGAKRAGILLLPPPGAVELVDAWAARLRGEGYAVGRAEIGPDATDALALTVLDAAATELAAESGVDAERIGAIGFGEAGTRALLFGCTRDRLAVVVLIQAPVLRATLSGARPFQPVEMVLNLTAPLAAHYGDADPEFSDHAAALETALAQGAKSYELTLHAGAGPTFFDPAGSGYHEPSVAAAWEAVRQFLAEHLE